MLAIVGILSILSSNHITFSVSHSRHTFYIVKYVFTHDSMSYPKYRSAMGHWIQLQSNALTNILQLCPTKHDFCLTCVLVYIISIKESFDTLTIIYIYIT